MPAAPFSKLVYKALRSKIFSCTSREWSNCIQARDFGRYHSATRHVCPTSSDSVCKRRPQALSRAADAVFAERALFLEENRILLGQNNGKTVNNPVA
ncbi:hypothetical protein N7524_004446 [Penicillium chrysogenum]|nr:hypothetical protein N7524_004446 [Penicillium chrysogenum]